MTRATEEFRLFRRYRLCVIFAVVSAFLTVLAVVVPMWIEELTGLEPDGGTGELEWLLALVPGACSIVLGLLAFRTRRKLATVQAIASRG